MRYQSLFVAALIAAPLISQSKTLPKGWDTAEGVEVGTATNSAFFAAFDTVDTTATPPLSYNPARVMFLYDTSEFPWDPKLGTVITSLSFRRDGPYTRNSQAATTAHTKDWTIIMSASSKVPARCNFHLFGANHGAKPLEVFGKIGKPKKVAFQATPAPGTGKTAPFDVTVSLDTPFVVPGNIQSLVIEIRSYAASVSTGWWRVDSAQWSNAYNGGAFRVTNTDLCVTPSIFYNSRPFMVGSNFGHIWRSRLAPGGRQVLSWLGVQNFTPFIFPGTVSCRVHVFPPLIVQSFRSGTSGQFGAYIDWGTVPLDLTLVGQQIGHQAMFIDPTYPGGVGLTRGGLSTLGSAYDPAVVKGSQLYSYGRLNARYLALTEPDNEVNSRYFYRRVPIIKIN